MRTEVELKIDELNRRKAPIVIIDESLDKYNDIVLFPEKLEKANEMLSKSGHPQEYINKHVK
jgi:hypothetical protein